MVRRASDNFNVIKLILVSHTRIFQQVLFLGLILLTEFIGPSDLLRLMDDLAIYFDHYRFRRGKLR